MRVTEKSMNLAWWGRRALVSAFNLGLFYLIYLLLKDISIPAWAVLHEGTLLFASAIDLLFSRRITQETASRDDYAYVQYIYGTRRTTGLKLLCIGLVAFGAFIDPITYSSGIRRALFYFVVVQYSFYALSLAAAVIWPRKTTAEFSLPAQKNNLDSLAGLLVYPFNSLRADVSLYDHRSQPLRWSWKAFLLPEVWFFNREIVGAGYATLLMLALCFLVYRTAGPGPGLALFILVRVASGLYAHKLYYARYGKLP